MKNAIALIAALLVSAATQAEQTDTMLASVANESGGQIEFHYIGHPAREGVCVGKMILRAWGNGGVIYGCWWTIGQTVEAVYPDGNIHRVYPFRDLTVNPKFVQGRPL